MLKKLKYTPLTTDEIAPEGWLKRQLEIQAEGLSGNLHKVWKDVRDSKWIGGECEGWERVPYWLDGFIPLAYLLNNEDMKTTAKRYVDAILLRQNEDGWICPCSKEERRTYDVWAAFLICKVLVVYYDCSKDDRIEEAVYKALKNLNDHLDGNTLFNWGMSRWFEGLIPIFWLYERRPEDWMIDLCFKCKIQGLNYRTVFEHWRMQQPNEHGKWSFISHVVNIAMALKSEGLFSRLVDGDGNDWAKQALNLLFRDHGMAAGHFTGDECLSGNSPVQGSELCSVVEAMYSYENLISITGDPYWSDLLEKLAFNALPAATSADMWTHQYDQMTNQVEVSYLPEDHVVFRTNSRESHLFGLEPNFGCCTANFNQGWPKFALSTVMKSETGFAITAIAPVTVNAMHNGVKVRIQIETDYPFGNGYRVSVITEKPLEMSLELRIPSVVKKAYVDGNETQCRGGLKLNGVWEKAKQIYVEFEYETKFVKRPNELFCIERGMLLYSLFIDEKWVAHEYQRDGVERKYPYCDYEIFAGSKWNYGFANRKVEVVEGTIGDYVFSNECPPIQILANVVEIDWGFEHGICLKQPKSRSPIGSVIKKRFIPYGCTDLRITELPMVNEE